MYFKMRLCTAEAGSTVTQEPEHNIFSNAVNTAYCRFIFDYS